MDGVVCVLSLCEGVLVDQGIEDTPRACMRRGGSGKRSGACWTGRYRGWCENILKLVTVFTHSWGSWFCNFGNRAREDCCCSRIPGMFLGGVRPGIGNGVLT